MKRASESQERDVTPNREKHARRQDPVSCQFCRTKKLKCDRMTPCSNCRARKRVCVSANEAIHGSVTSQPANIDGSASALALNPSLPNQSIEDLNARVKKIEDLLATTHPGSFTAHRQIERGSNSANTKGESSGDDVELSKTVVWLETDAFDYKPSPSDVHVNVNNYLSPNAQSPDAFASSFLSLITPSIGTSLDQHVIISTLPTRAQGQILLQYYADHVNWIYHILHIPTVRRKINLVYSALEQNQQPHYGDLSLVATVFALSAYFGYSSTSFQFQGVEAKEYSHRWTSLAQAALSAANFINIPSIETIQAAILISQHLLPNVGAIATFRTLAATAMHSARSLLIHQVDSPANKKRRESNPNVDWVDIETKRRLWWHIASTDWMLSFMSGPQCGTYMIHPKQMNVDYPANVDDEAIGTQPNYHQSVDAPTEMTYFIFRCKISEVFRDIVDSAANAGCELEDLSYDIVLEFDKKLHFLMNDAPLFFKFDPRSRLQSESIDARMPFIAYQRNMGQFGLHTRLSRLHRPYLARGAHDPRYSYSRIVCLRSARVVIELGSQMTASRPNFEPIRVWTIVHHIFVSTVILVMDYCFNREDPQAARRKEEILDCFRLLERSQEESTIARQGLKQLREFLNHRKWKRHAQIAGEPSSPVPQNQALPSMGMQENKNAAIIPVTQPPVQSADPLAAYDFSNQSSEWTNMDDNLLEYLNFDSSLDSSAWDTLFQNVESNNPLY